MSLTTADDRCAQHVAECVLSDWERHKPRSAPAGGPTSGARFSWEALVDVVGAHLPPVVLAAKFGVNDRQIHRWRSGPGLTWVQADELASRVGHHPGAIWPEWWETGEADDPEPHRETPRNGVGKCSGSTPRPFPFGDLVDRIAGDRTPSALAARLSVNQRQIYRWRRIGLTEVQADELAVRAGLHPANVWPDLWW